jgi:hypothetical protein
MLRLKPKRFFRVVAVLELHQALLVLRRGDGAEIRALASSVTVIGAIPLLSRVRKRRPRRDPAGVSERKVVFCALSTYLAPTISLTFSVSGFCSLALLRSCSSCR